MLPVIGYSIEESGVTLIYPYHKRQSLHDLMHNQKAFNLTYEEKMIFILKIALALEYLHEHDCCHNHLSSKNVIIDENMSPLVSDYGFKRVIESATIFLNYRNKNNYSAPEVLQNVKFDKYEGFKICFFKADIYSFGIMAWEIMTGVEPFGVTQKKLIELVVDGDKRPSVESIKQYAVTGLIQKCWERDQRKRPGITEVVNMLKQLQ